MCLIIEAEAPGISRQVAGKVSKGAKAINALSLLAQRSPRGTIGSRFWIAAPGEHCACKLLDSRFDSTETEISLAAGLRERLETTLRYLSEHAGGSGFTFRAACVRGAWADNHMRGQKVVTLSELLKAVQNGRTANNVKLEVHGPAAQPALAADRP